MAIDRQSFIESVKNNVEKVGSKKNTTYYKKELFAAVATMIDLEDQHKKKGTHIKKRLKIVVESVGEFLMQDPEESKK